MERRMLRISWGEMSSSSSGELGGRREDGLGLFALRRVLYSRSSCSARRWRFRIRYSGVGSGAGGGGAV